MALAGAGPGSMGGVYRFPLLRGPKYDAWSTIPKKLRLWSKVVMAMA